MSNRVAIVGARDASQETLEKVRVYVRGLPAGTVVVSGGATGVDETAESEAIACGLETCTFRVRDNRGRARFDVVMRPNMVRSVDLPMRATFRDALILRNSYIALSCDRMVAFVAGSRGGTWDAVKQAERFKRPVEVIR